jgi:hypothetical protein
MGTIAKPSPVKLIIGLIFQKEDCFLEAKRILEKKFGKTDFQSQTLAFTHTDYYQEEFGKNLKRTFLSFLRLIPPEQLAEIKTFTNKIERKLFQTGRRQVNIDPGYLNLSKLILATTKDFSHRIYLKDGIFAEVTLSYKDATYTAGNLTYPDYRTDEYKQIFNHIRKIYAQQIK